jgi:hypothetical protein
MDQDCYSGAARVRLRSSVTSCAEAVECDPLFRTAERFSSLKACQGSPFGRPPEAARFARPGQAFKDEKEWRLCEQWLNNEGRALKRGD